MKSQSSLKNSPSKTLYKNTYKNTLGNIRTHHRPAKRALSRLIHATGMDKVNEFFELTLLHPNIILSAVISSFVGEIFSVVMAEVFGYSYNYLLFIYFFTVGYIVSALYLIIFLRFKK